MNVNFGAMCLLPLFELPWSCQGRDEVPFSFDERSFEHRQHSKPSPKNFQTKNGSFFCSYLSQNSPNKRWREGLERLEAEDEDDEDDAAAAATSLQLNSFSLSLLMQKKIMNTSNQLLLLLRWNTFHIFPLQVFFRKKLKSIFFSNSFSKKKICHGIGFVKKFRFPSRWRILSGGGSKNRHLQK